MTMNMKRILLASLVVAVIIIAWRLHPTRLHWPTIRDPDQLVADAARGLADYKQTDHPWERDEWPSSIKALQPLNVIPRSNYVVIAFADNKTVWNFGYIIIPDGQFNLPHENDVTFFPTKDQRIWRYKAPPM